MESRSLVSDVKEVVSAMAATMSCRSGLLRAISAELVAIDIRDNKDRFRHVNEEWISDDFILFGAF
jgi:hypothetical protein